MEHPDNMAAPENIKPSYECPVCGIEDENAFMRCYRPNCTDGRARAPRLAGRFLIVFLYGIVILLLLNLFSLFC